MSEISRLTKDVQLLVLRIKDVMAEVRTYDTGSSINSDKLSIYLSHISDIRRRIKDDIDPKYYKLVEKLNQTDPVTGVKRFGPASVAKVLDIEPTFIYIRANCY